jgi:hypothetical protein
MGLLGRITGVAVASTASPALGWIWYTRATQVVPLPLNATGISDAIAQKYNPYTNIPILSDVAIRTVPLDQLKTTDQETLTRQFCQGIWAGPGFSFQRRYLERKYRALKGREDHLWEKKDLTTSPYEVGTKMVDHFEVVERTPERVGSNLPQNISWTNLRQVLVRCGDSPLNTGPRPSDGLFSVEVSKDDKVATFRLKSLFVNTAPEAKKGGQLPAWFGFLHREYTKLWMETSVRRLLK